MSTARDMAILGRRLVYDFPQYYNIFGRTSTSAGIATVQNTNRRLLEAYPGADGIKTGYTKAAGLQPRLLGAARRQAGDRRAARRQVDRLAQRRGGAADGPRLRQDAGDGAGRRRRRRCAARRSRPPAAPGPRRHGASATSRASWRSPAAVAGARRRAAGRCRGRSTARRSPATARRIAAAIAEVNAELDRRAGDPQRARRRRRATAGRCRGPARPPRPPRRRPRRRLGLDLRRRAARPRPVRAGPRARGRSQVASAGTGTTGGNDWGVQLGAFRAKGDAERQLLTTALKDVPELSGGLRRVEAAQGAGRDRLPRPVRRPEPVRRARRLRQRSRGCRPTACRWRRGSDSSERSR